jgi:hypothetical protein
MNVRRTSGGDGRTSLGAASGFAVTATPLSLVTLSRMPLSANGVFA